MSTNLSIEPNERVTFGILYQDDDLLVVSKPARIVTAPGVGHEHDTLLNGLFAQFGPELQNLGTKRDFGLLHRLDRETSGVLVVARNGSTYDALRDQFAKREIRKFYWAAVHKAPRTPDGVIKRAIEETVRRKTKYTSVKIARISGKGKPSVTAYRVLDANHNGALIEARPVTGRLHQVRVHLSSIGSTVLGDTVYGPKLVNKASNRLALHAHRLVFDHPATGEPIDTHCPMPKDFKALLRRMGLSLDGGGDGES